MTLSFHSLLFSLLLTLYITPFLFLTYPSISFIYLLSFFPPKKNVIHIQHLIYDGIGNLGMYFCCFIIDYKFETNPFSLYSLFYTIIIISTAPIPYTIFSSANIARSTTASNLLTISLVPLTSNWRTSTIC